MMEKNVISRDWFAIVNPNAGNGKGGKDRGRISDILNRNNIRFEMRSTGRKGQATEFTRDLIANGYRKIISIGGDGTLHEVINGILTQNLCASTDVTIGIIPVGTGNDWGGCSEFR